MTDDQKADRDMLAAHVATQGKCVVEKDGRGYLVMFPDGVIEYAPSRDAAEKRCKRWFRENLESTDIGIGEIEWR